MTAYMILKHLHVTTAYLTITLFALRLLLDAVGRPGWRQTPLRFIPHINDTILLVAAISLVFVAGYASAMPGWLIAKIVLLVGYIIAGVFRPENHPRKARSNFRGGTGPGAGYGHSSSGPGQAVLSQRFSLICFVSSASCT